jgi:CRISPR/Cas system CSM-associated protein Csm4 (group 5 of RAMP superfamily)
LKNIFDVDGFIGLLQTFALGLVAICSVLFLISLAPYIFLPLAFVALIFLFKSDKPKKPKKINFMDEVKFKDYSHGFELPRDEMSKIILKKVNKLIDKELKKAHLDRGYRTSEYTGQDINSLRASLQGDFVSKLGRSKRNVTPYLLSNQSKWDIFPINDFSIKTQEDMLKKLNVYNLEIRLLKE